MELLELFAQGELEAFETLFRQFQGEVYGWIIRIVRDQESLRTLQWRRFGESIRLEHDSTRPAALAHGPGASQPMPLSIISRPSGRSITKENQAREVPQTRPSNENFATGLSRPSPSYRQNSRWSRG